jgi:hypothetical protein
MVATRECAARVGVKEFEGVARLRESGAGERGRAAKEEKQK